MASIDEAASQKCFPKLAALLDKYQDLKQQAEAKQAAAVAEAQRQEVERHKPVNRVTEGYALYRLVRHCNEIRRGYALQYVNDDELNRAMASIQKLVRRAKKDEPNINTDDLWNKSAALANNRPIGHQPCQHYLERAS